MKNKTVCILGGGIGGVAVATQLRERLDSSNNIIVVDKNSEHVFAPSLLWVLEGKRKTGQIKRNLDLLNKKGIKFINSAVKNIFPQENKVLIDNEAISYDYLIVALGAELNMAAIDGLSKAAINLYDLDGILKLKKAINDFSGGEIVILIPSMPYKCPAAPYEAAFFLANYFQKRNLRKETNISIYTFEPLPMPTAGAKIGQNIKQLLDKRDIGFNSQVTLKSVDPQNKEAFFQSGDVKRADLLITVPPHKAPDVVKEASLTNEAGWIPVDKKTLKTKYDNIYAIGDIATIRLEGRYKPDKPLMLPKAGVFAHEQAKVVAVNIASQINGKSEIKEFDGKGSCFLELGDGTAGYAAGSFYEPDQPLVEMKKPSRLRHYYKVLFEKYWFWKHF